MTTVLTRFGEVDAAGLSELQRDFDPQSILDAVDQLDVIRSEIEAMRDELLRLHEMAKALIDDDDPSGPDDGLDGDVIWELAGELSSNMFNWPDDIESVCDTLDVLSRLAPDTDAPDSEDDDDELDLDR